MRKISSLCLVLLLVLCLSIPAFAQCDYVVDDADLLTEAEEKALSDRLEEISQEYGMQVAVATVSEARGVTDDEDMDAYVSDYFDEYFGEDHDGVLLLVSMNPRKYRILSNGTAADAISVRDGEAIGDRFASDLSDGNYADAFDIYAEECDYYFNGAVNGFPFDVGGTLLIAVIIGLVVGLIVALCLRGQLKSVKPQNQANVYVKPGSLHVTTAKDFYLYSTVTRVKKQTSNSSSSGGSRNISGGNF